VRMQLINRQRFNATVDAATGKPTNIRLNGQPRLPGADEQGWKDTWVMNPGEVTRVIATFDKAGMYVWHCHILSHEEHDMMRPFYVGALPVDLTKNKPVANGVTKLETALQLRMMPNPFNNYFTIQFKLAKPQKVEIRLYDDNGAVVRQVYSGTRSAGLQTLLIKGDDLAQGIYLCEMVLSDKRIIRKLVLQR
jgi:spore coat protein A, manganese oxidase